MSGSAHGFESRADLGRLRSLDGVKWSRHRDDVIPAWVADMDLLPPPMALEAIQRVVDRADFGYNLVARSALTEAFSRWQSEAHGWEPDPEHCVLFNDVLHAIDYTLWHTTDPGDGIVLLTPIYPPFLAALASSGRRLVDVPLRRSDDGWHLDPEILDAAIDDTTRVILSCNPHNPTGHVFTAAELTAIAEVAERRDLLVISDEVWGDLVHPGSVHLPAPMVSPTLADRSVTISAASKSFNLAGLRSAVAHLGSPSVRTQFLDHPGHLRGAVNTLGAEAALACWREARPWLDQLRTHLAAQRDHLASRLAGELPAIWWVPPQATYLAWLDVAGLEIGPEPARTIRDRCRIALSSGLDFGSGGSDFVRLNFATDRALLDLMIDRLVDEFGQTA